MTSGYKEKVKAATRELKLAIEILREKDEQITSLQSSAKTMRSRISSLANRAATTLHDKGMLAPTGAEDTSAIAEMSIGEQLNWLETAIGISADGLIEGETTVNELHAAVTAFQLARGATPDNDQPTSSITRRPAGRKSSTSQVARQPSRPSTPSPSRRGNQPAQLTPKTFDAMGVESKDDEKVKSLRERVLDNLKADKEKEKGTDKSAKAAHTTDVAWSGAFGPLFSSSDKGDQKRTEKSSAAAPQFEELQSREDTKLTSRPKVPPKDA